MLPIKNKKTKKAIVLPIIALIVTGAAILVLLFIFQKKDTPQTDGVNLNPPTKEEQQDAQNTKLQTVDQDQEDKSSGSANGSTANTSADLPVSISATNKTDSLLQIRVVIDTLVSSGTCTIVLKNNTSVQRMVDTTPLASTSTCKGFDIPLSDLSAGQWTYTVTVKDSQESRTGTATGTVSI